MGLLCISYTMVQQRELKNYARESITTIMVFSEVGFCDITAGKGGSGIEVAAPSEEAPRINKTGAI